MGQKLRTRLDLLHPDCSTQVRLEQALQKQRADKHRYGHVFLLGQRVFAQNYGPGPRWMAGVIAGVCGGVNYEVRVNGCLWRRHADQIRSHGDSPVIEDLGDPCPSESTPVVTDPISREMPNSEEDGTRLDTRNCTPDQDVTTTPMPSPSDSNQDTSAPPVCRYPARSHQPPERYGYTPNSRLEEGGV